MDPDADDNDLNHAELMELWLGPSSDGSCFETREALQCAWAKGRAYVMATWAKAGRRPQAWWEFESPLPYPGRGREKSALYSAGLMGARERKQVVSEWRREFQRAQAADFTVTVGPDRILRGPAAQEAHYAWCDLPLELQKKWSAERRRSKRQAVEETAPA
jgi:hypothetical protein